jgi:isochorismate synthase
MSILPIQYARLLDELIARGIAFACYFLPFSTKPTLIVEDEEPAVLLSYGDLDGKDGFVFAPFILSTEKPLLLFKSKNVYSGFVDKISMPMGGIVLNGNNSDHSTTPEIYDATFRRFMEQLKGGRFSKLVLSRKLVVDRHAKSIGKVFLNAKDAYLSAFTYLVNAPKSGLWLGATPELLFKGDAGCFQTVALAGTMPVSEGVSEYTWSAKDREEQQMVTDYISERLTSCGVTEIEKDGPSTAKAGNVVHLKTTFKFTADGNVGVGTLVNTLHPTPAVCGLPKEEAQQYIIETEQHDREYYTGFAGVVSSNKEAELYVNLRCMKVEQQQLSLFAGGGITAKSVGEREWMETNHKLRTLQSIIEADD